MKIHLIWAQDENGGIGKDGKLPWHISEDLQNFKKLRHYCAGQQPLPIQEVATALWNEDSHSEKNRQKYIKKFEIAKEIFKKYNDFYIPDGGFYLWLKVGNGEKFAKLLWKEKGIKVIKMFLKI